jgi:hypothetical protein
MVVKSDWLGTAQKVIYICLFFSGVIVWGSTLSSRLDLAKKDIENNCEQIRAIKAEVDLLKASMTTIDKKLDILIERQMWNEEHSGR